MLRSLEAFREAAGRPDDKKNIYLFLFFFQLVSITTTKFVITQTKIKLSLKQEKTENIN